MAFAAETSALLLTTIWFAAPEEPMSKLLPFVHAESLPVTTTTLLLLLSLLPISPSKLPASPPSFTDKRLFGPLYPTYRLLGLHVHDDPGPVTTASLLLVPVALLMPLGPGEMAVAPLLTTKRLPALESPTMIP